MIVVLLQKIMGRLEGRVMVNYVTFWEAAQRVGIIFFAITSCVFALLLIPHT